VADLSTPPPHQQHQAGRWDKQISEELKISPGMAALWRGRFLLQGVEGLLKNSSLRQGARLDSSSDGQYSD
jgi:hypothetical protein